MNEKDTSVTVGSLPTLQFNNLICGLLNDSVPGSTRDLEIFASMGLFHQMRILRNNSDFVGLPEASAKYSRAKHFCSLQISKNNKKVIVSKPMFPEAEMGSSISQSILPLCDN